MSFFPTQELKTVLSSAQLLTLNSAPVLLIPGKTGCLIELQSMYFRYFHGTTQFNPGANDFISVYFGPAVPSNPVVPPYIMFAQGFVDQTVDQSAWNTPAWGGNGNGNIPFPLSSYIGTGISINQWNEGDTFPTGTDWTQGNGSLAVFIKYAYVEVS